MEQETESKLVQPPVQPKLLFSERTLLITGVLGAGAFLVWAFHRADWKTIQICCMAVTFLMSPFFQIINRRFKDDTTKQKHWWVFWISAIAWLFSGLLLAVSTSKSQQHQETQSRQFTDQFNKLSSKIAGAEEVQNKYETLVQQIVTNPVYQVDFRLSILEAARTNRAELNPKLESMKAFQEDLSNKIKEKRLFAQLNFEKQIQNQQHQRLANYSALYSCADYAVRQAIRMSEVSVGEVICNYKEIPISMASYPTNGTIATIQAKTNALWNLKITIDSLDPAFLRVDIKGTGSMLAMVSDGREELDLPDLGNEIFHLDVTDYKTNIDEKVRFLIANEANKAFSATPR